MSPRHLITFIFNHIEFVLHVTPHARRDILLYSFVRVRRGLSVPKTPLMTSNGHGPPSPLCVAKALVGVAKQDTPLRAAEGTEKIAQSRSDLARIALATLGVNHSRCRMNIFRRKDRHAVGWPIMLR